MEKRLCSILVLLVVALAKYSFAGFAGYDEASWEQAANFLQEGYMPSADPCKNFTQYACGKWYERDSDDGEVNQISIQMKDMMNKIETAVNKVDVDNPATPNYEKWVKQFYDACNVNASSKLDIAMQLYEELSSIMGTPPLFGKDTKTKIFMQKDPWYFVGFVQRELPFAAPFFKLTVQTAKLFDNITIAALVIDQKYEEMRPINKVKLENAITLLAKAMNIKVDQKEMDKKIDAMIEFEKSIAENVNNTKMASAQRENTKDFSYQGRFNALEEEKNFYTVEKLKRDFSNVSWDEFFLGLLTRDQHDRFNESYTKVYLPGDEEEEKAMFDGIDMYFDHAGMETIFNYVFYKALLTLYEDITEIRPRWAARGMNKCLNDLSTIFNSAVTRMLFDDNKLDPLEWRADIELMKETIFGAARFLFAGSSTWDDEEKMKLITKLNQITFNSGIPDWIVDNDEVEKRTIRYKDHLTNVQNTLLIQKGNFERNLDYILNEFQGQVDAEPVLETNANYQNFHINMYLGWTFLPWYSPKYPLAVKYGNIGWLIGHEMMHAFDSNGVEEAAKRTKSDWLSASTMKEYKKKIDCVTKQYSSFCVAKNKCLSGKKTLSENIADIDGLKVAYMAYKFASMTAGKDNPLPGLTDLTPDQIFFLTYGRCSCASNGDIENWFDDPDVHSPYNARLNFPIKNFDKFATTFQCKAGSTYDSSNRCIVWGEYKGDEQAEL